MFRQALVLSKKNTAKWRRLILWSIHSWMNSSTICIKKISVGFLRAGHSCFIVKRFIETCAACYLHCLAGRSLGDEQMASKFCLPNISKLVGVCLSGSDNHWYSTDNGKHESNKGSDGKPGEIVTHWVKLIWKFGDLQIWKCSNRHATKERQTAV